MQQKKITRTYSELKKLKTFEERFEYLRLNGSVGAETFGFDRYLNQALYNSEEWRRARNKVIIRDNGCDMGVKGFDIFEKPLIHHMNPITKQQVIDRDPDIFNPEYLITVSHETHNAIHYGDESIVRRKQPLERKPGDTRLW